MAQGSAKLTGNDHGLLTGLTDPDHDHGDLAGLGDDDHSAYPAYTEWTSYSPSYNNLTVGNGSVTAEFAQIGKTVHALWEFTLGSTSVMGSTPQVSLPITARSISGVTPLGLALAWDSSPSNVYQLIMTMNSSTTFILLTWNVTGTYPKRAALGASAPFSWATGDLISARMTYQAAAAV